LKAQEEAAERTASAKAECSRLQEELGCKLELIEQLQKELEAAKTAAHSVSLGLKKVFCFFVFWSAGARVNPFGQCFLG